MGLHGQGPAAAYVKDRVSGDGVPDGLDWDAWLGVAAERPYLHLYPADIAIHDPWGARPHRLPSLLVARLRRFRHRGFRRHGLPHAEPSVPLPRRSEPSSDGHYAEFLDAIAGEGPVFAETSSRCYSDTGLSIPMMECALGGAIAQRLPLQKLRWDSKRWRFDSPAADALANPAFRAGHGI